LVAEHQPEEKNIQRKLAEGTSGWLLFEFHCLRGNLFNEKYLSYPIGQILTSITRANIISEVNHPILMLDKKVGRPPQLDFVITDDKKKWKVVIESKWVGNTEISIGYLIWDLIRLQILKEEYDLQCFFVLAGFEKKLKILLKHTHLIEESTYPYITLKSQHCLIFDLNKLDTRTKTFINSKIANHKNAKFYDKIYCKPAHNYPKESINMSFSTYVWEVLKTKTGKRIEFLE
jgi:hypothetical protein